MKQVKVYFTYKGYDDEVIFNYDEPSDVQPLFEEWLTKRGLKLSDLDNYWT